MIGREMEELQFDARLLHPLAKRGFATSTIRGHRAVLRWVSESIPMDLRDAPLAMALVELVNRQRLRKKWRWSTTATKMAQLQGALSSLPLYARLNGTLRKVTLAHCPVWVASLRAATRKAREQLGNQPKAVTSPIIRAIAQNSLIPISTRAAVALTWLTAARCSDSLQLRQGDVTLKGTTLTVTWARGKTVARRGPYTVSSDVPPVLLPLLQACCGGTTPTNLLFPETTGRMLKIALRSTGDRALEQRSIRRGALQQLAAQKMPTAVLLLFSGHTTERMLMRYLGHGRLATADQERMIDASKMALRS
jgi:integrase